jgi:hypothetical protein
MKYTLPSLLALLSLLGASTTGCAVSSQSTLLAAAEKGDCAKISQLLSNMPTADNRLAALLDLENANWDDHLKDLQIPVIDVFHGQEKDGKGYIRVFLKLVGVSRLAAAAFGGQALVPFHSDYDWFKPS